MNRCRLCISNDREALIDEKEAGAGEVAGYGGEWNDVNPTCRVGFPFHAELMLRVLER